MFNYITVEFPETDVPLQRVVKFNLTQENYSHESVSIMFRDWDPKYTNIIPGNPIRALIRSTGGVRVFEGVIHTINPKVSPGKRFVEMNAIGASFQLKQGRQRIFTDKTADEVIKQIATENKFSVYATPHPRKYPQITQAGHTDLELMSRLAQQCGYAFRVENTTIYFRPFLFDYVNYRDAAPKFTMRNANDPSGSTLYSFNATIGDTLNYGNGYKAAMYVSGVDSTSATSFSSVSSYYKKETRAIVQNELFDGHATRVVAPTEDVAKHEAKAASELNRFPYRATVLVEGNPTLRPDKPVFLEGIGAQYSGYWIVLSATHMISEESTNVFKYVTILTVGTDSLGSAAPYIDPTSTLTQPIIAPEQATPSSILVVDPKPYNLVSNTSVSKPVWTSSVRDIGKTTVDYRRSSAVRRRLGQSNVI